MTIRFDKMYLVLVLISILYIPSLSYGDNDDTTIQNATPDAPRLERQNPRRKLIRDNVRDNLTDEQVAAVREHKAMLREKHTQIDAILSKTNEEYKSLSNKADKGPEDRRRMISLRRQIIANSPEAKEILNQINSLNNDFRKQNPDIAKGVRPKIREIKEINQKLRNLLISNSDPEVAELINKKDKTDADWKRLREIRKEFIRDNPEITKEIIQRKRNLKDGIRDRIRKLKQTRDAQTPDVPTRDSTITPVPPRSASTDVPPK